MNSGRSRVAGWSVVFIGLGSVSRRSGTAVPRAPWSRPTGTTSSTSPPLAVTPASRSLTPVHRLDLDDVDEAILQHVIGHALSCPMSHDDGVARQEREFWMPDLDAIAAGDVQPERLEGSSVETFLDGLAEHKASSSRVESVGSFVNLTG